MTKFKKSLLSGPKRTTNVHFQYQRGFCLFSYLLKVGFKHGLYV